LLGAADFNWWSWIVFAIVASITPGPNNAMLLASGVRFGVRRSAAHLSGITVGFFAMFIATAAGLGALLVTLPASQAVLEVLAVAVFIWMAYRMATAPFARIGDDSPASAHGPGAAAAARPMTFFGAVAFQWVNPKAWVACVGAAGAFLGPDPTRSMVVLLGVTFAAVTVPCAGAWLVFGAAMRRFLDTPLRQKVFNVSMAALLLASLVTVLR
jgi:threonine/homoserine/homoserine lactone efflux protein